MTLFHKPVLLEESVAGLDIKPDGIYVDATFGGGGHSREILKNIKKGWLIAFDQDQDARQNKIDDERFILINHNFRYIKNFLKFHNITHVDGILADLGLSSHHIDQTERGFTFKADSDLDMRMNRNKKLTAADIINTYTQDKIADILYKYGEIKNAGKIAEIIVKTRTEKKIKTSHDLTAILQKYVPGKQTNKFFAKVFQALRIEVNDEINSLKEFLEHGYNLLSAKGRMVIISYHSLEDRIVKNFFRTGNFEGEIRADIYGHTNEIFRQVNKKVIVPDEKEIQENNRARSAKLRIAEKV
jgi:16S rRNA (cytosine1402-N4)-methyltransferase